jgi:uncharacterized protein (TIGR03000 family)
MNQEGGGAMSSEIVRRAAAVSVVLALATCGSLVASGGDGKPAWVDRILPDEATMVMVADVAEIVGHPIVKAHYLPRLKASLERVDPNVEIALDAFGFDPLRETASVLLTATVLGPKPRGLVLAINGRFAEEHIRELLRQIVKDSEARLHTVSVERRRIGEVVEFPSSDGEAVFLSLVDGTTLLFSTERDMVASAVTNVARDRKPDFKNSRFRDLLARVDRSQTVWFVALGSGLEPESGNELAKKGLEAFWGGATLHEDGFRVEFVVSAIDPRKVQQLAEEVRLRMTVDRGKLITASKKWAELAPLVALMNCLQVAVEDVDARPGQEIVVRGGVSADLFVQSLAKIRVQSPTADQLAYDPGDLFDRVARSTVLLLGSSADSMGAGTLIHLPVPVILTSYHVVEGMSRVYACFPIYRNGKLVAEPTPYSHRVLYGGALRGRVVAEDPERDLALVQLRSVPEGTVALRLAKQSAAVAETVHAVGHGGEGTLWIYNKGTVRQVARRQHLQLHGRYGRASRIDARVVLADCPVNEGDSGGPLVNNRGHLVGVNTAAPFRARRMSMFIDVEEVQDFLADSGPDWQAEIVVHLPAEAELQIKGVPTPWQGEIRRFRSQPLRIARKYRYPLKATWQEDGKTVVREKTVEFYAGQAVHVDLRQQPGEEGSRTR